MLDVEPPTQEELLRIPSRDVGDVCPACLAYGTRCLVAAHPSTAAAAMTGNKYFFLIILLFLFNYFTLSVFVTGE